MRAILADIQLNSGSFAAEKSRHIIRGNDMQITGELKDKVDKAESKEEAKKAIEDAGMILDDAELDQVAGGITRLTKEL